MLYITFVIINAFIWDDFNIQHIAKHQISPNEVEEVLNRPYIITKEERKRHTIYGITLNNRMIIVVIESRDNDNYYPITAYDMSSRQKKFYNQ